MNKIIIFTFLLFSCLSFSQVTKYRASEMHMNKKGSQGEVTEVMPSVYSEILITKNEEEKRIIFYTNPKKIYDIVSINNAVIEKVNITDFFAVDNYGNEIHILQFDYPYEDKIEFILELDSIDIVYNVKKI